LIHSKEETPEEILTFIGVWEGRVPLVLVPTAYPELTEADIAGLGTVDVVICGNHAVKAAVGAMRSVFAQIRRAGGIREVDKTLPSVRDIIRLQGDDYMRGLEVKFLS
jgi:phosphoenolpyruvate phosphomutase